ncbi:MAG: histidine phosphatase family protein [Promethearchaeota archaeon]
MFDLVQERDIGEKLSSRTMVYVVTHAENDPENPSELSENGKTQAFELARSRVATGVFTIYSSTMGQAISTAEALREEFGANLKTAKELIEVRLGKDQPSPEKLIEILPKLWEDPDYEPSNGESLMNARKRLSDFMNQIIGKHKGEAIAVVTHPMMAVLFHTLVRGGIPDIADWLAMGYASCAAYEYSKDGWSLVLPYENSFLTTISVVRDRLPTEVLDSLDSP